MAPDLIAPTDNFRIGTKFVVIMATTTPLRLQAASLREWVLSQTAKDVQSSTSTVPTTFKVVDVRDDDFVGGSIPGTLNIPSRRFGSRVDSLVDELKDNEAVVFTCALSQQRGPNVTAL